ncbi:MAG: hypothetical protein WDO13_17390 [Verrucomicrobiota bacterium]
MTSLNFLTVATLREVELRLPLGLAAERLDPRLLVGQLGLLFLHQLLARLHLVVRVGAAGLEVIELRLERVALLAHLQRLVAHDVGGRFVLVVLPIEETRRRREANRDQTPKDRRPLRASHARRRADEVSHARPLAAKPPVEKRFAPEASVFARDRA